jgi:hypothetical protein
VSDAPRQPLPGRAGFQPGNELPPSEDQRLVRARGRGREALASLAEEASRTPLSLVCQPPPPAKPFAYGDLVPLGFLLRAANAGGLALPLRSVLEGLLRGKRQRLLWAYHSDTLITCIDSALVLQGFRDPAGIEALELFADGRGGYFPQLCSEKPERDKMTITPHNRHWCQPEYGTACLVSALRAEAGLAQKTSVQLLEEGFESRSGLYFANPYVVDWALAWALQGVASATALRERLATDILASVNEDGSFGLYDVSLSTALAILALTSLGVGGGAVHLARLRLADLMMPDGTWPSSTPFYSAVQIPRERMPGGVLARLMLGERQGQFLWLEGVVHAVSLYVDGYRTISSALASLSLMPSGPSDGRGTLTLPKQRRGSCHPRYRCADHMEYVAGYALPPYVVERKPEESVERHSFQ